MIAVVPATAARKTYLLLKVNDVRVNVEKASDEKANDVPGRFSETSK